jgi:tetratricopeptide (TPR) repeat protein
MKFLLAIFLFLSLAGDGLKEASRINQAVQEAEGLFRRGQYRQAMALYQFLADSLQVTDDALILNQAHAAFLAGEEAKATRNYNLLARNPDPVLQSIASTQLGLLYFRKDNPERALYTFKKALIQDPLNETARFNYELLKKYLAANPSGIKPRPRNPLQQQPQPGQKQDKAGQSSASKPAKEGQEGTAPDEKTEGDKPPINRPDATGSDSRGGSGPSGTRQPRPGAQGNRRDSPQGRAGNGQQGLSDESGNSLRGNRNKEGTEALNQQEKQMQTLRARLKDSDLSPEKATQLLEAIRNAELQYLQQVPRKTQKPRSDNQPDW